MPTDFEEKYLLLRDENTALKKKKNEQEATIKRCDCLSLRRSLALFQTDATLIGRMCVCVSLL